MERTWREQEHTLTATILPLHTQALFFSQSGSYGRSQAIATRFYCDSWEQTLGETSEDSGSKEKHCRSPWTKIKRRTRTHLGVHATKLTNFCAQTLSLVPQSCAMLLWQSQNETKENGDSVSLKVCHPPWNAQDTLLCFPLKTGASANASFASRYEY